MRIKALVLFALALFVMSLSSCTLTLMDDGDREERLKVGDRIPSNVYFITADGHDVTSQALREGDVMLVFFSVTCPDCRQELPVVQGLYNDYRDRVKFYLVSATDNYRMVEDYFNQSGFTMPFVASDGNFRFAELGRSGRVPTCWFIRNGRIAGVWYDSPMMSRDDFVTVLGRIALTQ